MKNIDSFPSHISFAQDTFIGSRYLLEKKRKQEDMEKTVQNVCPKCGEGAMNVYYEDDSDVRLGAWCESCDLKGFFVGKELFEVGRV